MARDCILAGDLVISEYLLCKKNGWIGFHCFFMWTARLRSDWAKAQSDLSFCWAHRSLLFVLSCTGGVMRNHESSGLQKHMRITYIGAH